MKLILYVNSRLAIPPEYGHLLPSSSLTLEEMTTNALPSVDSRFLILSASLFSPLNPDRPASWHLEGRGVSPLAIVDTMAATVGQAILSNAQSVRDPHYQRGCLPLWAITYFERAHHAVSVRVTIKSAQSWLPSARNLASLTMRMAIDKLDVYVRLFTLSWDEPLKLEGAGSPATACQLLSLLGNVMLSDELVDMMCGWIEREARH